MRKIIDFELACIYNRELILSNFPNLPTRIRTNRDGTFSALDTVNFTLDHFLEVRNFLLSYPSLNPDTFYREIMIHFDDNTEWTEFYRFDNHSKWEINRRIQDLTYEIENRPIDHLTQCGIGLYMYMGPKENGKIAQWAMQGTVSTQKLWKIKIKTDCICFLSDLKVKPEQIDHPVREESDKLYLEKYWIELATIHQTKYRCIVFESDNVLFFGNRNQIEIEED